MNLSPGHGDRLAAAKLWLIGAADQPGAGAPRDLPYLARALYSLIPVPSRDVARMTCDEHWRIYVNTDWVETAPIPAIGAELAHLGWHLLQDHAGRARDVRVDAATASHWRLASDAAIEHTLAADALVPDGLAAAAALGLRRGLSAEEYYAALSGLPVGTGEEDHREPGDPGCGSGCDGLTRGHELPPGFDHAQIGPEEAHQIRRLVAIAYREHVTERGTQPGDAWRWTQHILEPTIAWQPLLGSAVRRAVAWTNGNTNYTYTRRSRRQSALPNVVLPGTRRPVPNVALVIDTSGSVDDLLLSRALGEVDGTLRSLGVSGSTVTVLACDTAVHAVTRVRKVRETALVGGGGTDMRVGVAAAAELRPRPDVIVVFTDGYTLWPAQRPPGSVVIAAILGRPEHMLPPSPVWARRVECRL
ncbi:VWA-like domain-containing protein [soil metagenome]